MKCKHCGGKTNVINTVHQAGGTRRQRDCVDCKARMYSAEVPIQTDAQGLYSKEDAAQLRKNKILTRRKSEDRRDKDAT